METIKEKKSKVKIKEKENARNIHSKIAVTVIRELSQLKEISVKARNINSRKRKRPTKQEGTRVSEVQTEKIRKVIGHRKETSTEGQIEEEEEITILKVINHTSSGTNVSLPDPPQKKKNLRGQKKMSRQEKLYQDILAEENKTAKKRTIAKQNQVGKENIRNEAAGQRRKAASLAEEREWAEKFRQWSPSQKWPITECWGRDDETTRGRIIIISNRETRRILKF